MRCATSCGSVDARRIAAIGVSALGPAPVLVSERPRAARSRHCCSASTRERKDERRALVDSLPLADGALTHDHALPKLLWWREHEPGAMGAARAWRWMRPDSSSATSPASRRWTRSRLRLHASRATRPPPVPGRQRPAVGGGTAAPGMGQANRPPGRGAGAHRHLRLPCRHGRNGRARIRRRGDPVRHDADHQRRLRQRGGRRCTGWSPRGTSARGSSSEARHRPEARRSTGRAASSAPIRDARRCLEDARSCSPGLGRPAVPSLPLRRAEPHQRPAGTRRPAGAVSRHPAG